MKARRLCGYGPGPCGKPGARLFTDGWKCPEHAPPVHLPWPVPGRGPVVVALSVDGPDLLAGAA